MLYTKQIQPTIAWSRGGLWLALNGTMFTSGKWWAQLNYTPDEISKYLRSEMTKLESTCFEKPSKTDTICRAAESVKTLIKVVGDTPDVTVCTIRPGKYPGSSYKPTTQNSINRWLQVWGCLGAIMDFPFFKNVFQWTSLSGLYKIYCTTDLQLEL